MEDNLTIAVEDASPAVRAHSSDQRMLIRGLDLDILPGDPRYNTYKWDATTWLPDGTLAGGTAEEDFNDVIYAGAGNDKVLGLGGNDALDGGAGNDSRRSTCHMRPRKNQFAINSIAGSAHPAGAGGLKRSQTRWARTGRMKTPIDSRTNHVGGVEQ